MANSATQQLPRPPVHGRYDFSNNETRRRRGNVIKFGCVALIAAILIAFAIYGIFLVFSFKNARVPRFQVKAVQVSKFDVANILSDEQKVLSTDLVFNLESDNKNPMVKVDLGNMVMETTWNEVEAHLGETHVENVVIASKGASILKVSAHGKVELSKKIVKKEDMKLDLVLSGDLKFFSGPFKTKTYPFMVSCNDISSDSLDVVCDSKLFTNGESSPPPTQKAEAPSSPKAPLEKSPAEPTVSINESQTPPRKESSVTPPSPLIAAREMPAVEPPISPPSPLLAAREKPAVEPPISPPSPLLAAREKPAVEPPISPPSPLLAAREMPAVEPPISPPSPLLAAREMPAVEPPISPPSPLLAAREMPSVKPLVIEDHPPSKPPKESSVPPPSPLLAAREIPVVETPVIEDHPPPSTASLSKPTVEPPVHVVEDHPPPSVSKEPLPQSQSPQATRGRGAVVEDEPPLPSPPKASLPKEKPPIVEDRPPPSPPKESFPPVKLIIQDKFVILSNGFLAATIAKPAGYVTGIQYNGIENILDTVNPDDDRGYWDVVWAPPGTKGTKGNFQRIVAKDFRVIIERVDQIELSFKLAYNPTTDAKKAAPMEIDQRYVMLQGVSGIYAYGIFERAAWPQFGMPNARLAFKLQRQKFKYMVIADNRQREMPVPEDRMKPRGQELEYPEAVLLVDPIDPKLKGEVDDKYQYSMESQDIRVHGWICKDPPTGFWQITPSYEFRSGGPNKQFLTSHVGPSTLAMFVSAHYSGEELIPKFQEGEPWNHIYGPIFMYMNNITNGENIKLLWEDAKEKMLAEVKSWPYNFPASEDFPKANERVNVTGRFFVHDRYVTDEKVPAKGSFIGLGPLGEAGSWQRDCKTYQFWTQTDDEGYFKIPFVRVGNYDVHGWVNGYIGDFKHKIPVTITVGHNVDLGELVFEPLRDGPTLWEIGIPDRLAKEFYIPDPNPKFVNKLYVNHPDRFRQYGLWERYTELYPSNDLIYNVNTSDYTKDWFYAQVTRQVGGRYNGTTWQVRFHLEDVVPNGIYKLRVALASATNSDLEVRFNQPKPSPAIFISGRIGNDNSIARHGIHGLYWLFNIDVKGTNLRKGNNTMFLTQTKGVSPFQGLMYDYMRLESPATNIK
ncbi:hypothetical protein vseg_019220 [Gypsophila vaccaria]